MFKKKSREVEFALLPYNQSYLQLQLQATDKTHASWRLPFKTLKSSTLSIQGQLIQHCSFRMGFLYACW